MTMTPSTNNLPSSQHSDRSSAPESLTSASEKTDTGVTPDEFKAQRAEKLAAISAAVAAGHYDSDEMLEKALGIMLDRLDAD